MSNLTERDAIRFIRVVLPERAIEVTRVHEVLRDGKVIATTPHDGVQQLLPGAELSGVELEPEVLAVTAAVWTPQDVAAAGAALREALARERAETLEHERLHDEQLQGIRAQRAEQLKADEEMLQALKRSHAAVMAAHRELEAEHQVLAERSAKVGADRAALFAQAETIRRQKPKLAELVEGLAAELKTQ